MEGNEFVRVGAIRRLVDAEGVELVRLKVFVVRGGMTRLCGSFA